MSEVCGGPLKGGKTCDVCFFDYALMQWLARVRVAMKDVYFEIPIRFCPSCGVALGTSEEGEPTRELMKPANQVQEDGPDTGALGYPGEGDPTWEW